MADNYLERRMEELRNPRKPMHISQKKAPKGKLYIPDITHYQPEQIKVLQKEGWQIWFGGGEIHSSARLARTLGAHFLPPGMPAPSDCKIVEPSQKR